MATPYLQLLLCISASVICRYVGAATYAVPLYKLDTRINKAVQEASLRTRSSSDEGWLPYNRGNLRGQPGEGYYVEMAIGTPQQKVNHSYHFFNSQISIKLVDIFHSISPKLYKP